jgi:hypothetical protein
MCAAPQRVVLRSVPAAALAAMLAFATAGASTAPDGMSLGAALAPLERLAHTGVLYDRVLPLAHLERHDGSAAAPVADLVTWRQAYDELRRASLTPPAGPDPAALVGRAREARRAGVIPLALIDRMFDRVRPGALAEGAIAIGGDRVPRATASALVSARAFLATALVPRTHHGAGVTFVLDPADVHAGAPIAPGTLSIDFADGAGPRVVAPGTPMRVAYRTTGRHVLTLRLTRPDGTVSQSRFAFDVAALATPAPDDTLHVTATVPHQGQYGTGDAYVYLAAGHTSLVQPVVVIEGFDLDNSMGWDELYQLLGQQGLIESLRAQGFDLVVLDFTDATVPIQENGLLVAQLIQQVESAIAPATTIAVVGASMGALCSRHALAWLETQGISHRVRTWISFDGPHAGAVIPLGLQHWIDFFSSQSTAAAAFRATLERPAARQMLLNHFTNPATSPPQPDPLRAGLLADLAALGDYPQYTRRVAIANGSGAALDQGFPPGEQVIRYEYSSFLVAVTGNVWASPNLASGTIFRGSLRIGLSTTSRTVTIAGSPPWDGAPGGSRASFTELDATAAPFGDIVALHPAHCFIPTVSALALSTGDPFHDVAGDPALAEHTPFDAVHFPAANEEHVFIAPGSAMWVKEELERGLLAVPGTGGRALAVRSAGPNPFAGRAQLALELPEPRTVDVAVFAIDGRRVRTLARGLRPAGPSALDWDGRDERGAAAGAGVYFIRATAGGAASVLRVVKLDGG